MKQAKWFLLLHLILGVYASSSVCSKLAAQQPFLSVGFILLYGGMLAALVAASARMWMPGMMAFCAGAMMWVVIAEMIPEAAQGRAGVISAMAGYALMMALDIALG